MTNRHGWLVLLLLAGCSSTVVLDREVPTGFDLDGHWVVDASASEVAPGTQRLRARGIGISLVAHDFPVLRVERVWRRRDPIWPFTVVGRPPQEDTTFGELIHELTGPVIPTLVPGLRAVHAVDAVARRPLAAPVRRSNDDNPVDGRWCPPANARRSAGAKSVPDVAHQWPSVPHPVTAPTPAHELTDPPCTKVATGTVGVNENRAHT